MWQGSPWVPGSLLVAGKLAFALREYVLLGIFVVAAFGLGRPLAGWIARDHGLSRLLGVPLQISAGMGLIMAALFVAGLLGALIAPVVGVLILIGLVLALVPARPAPAAVAAQPGEVPRSAWWWGLIAVLLCLPLLVTPLRPPLAWDELAYHLPYARFWAEQGALTVNPWLRYPLSAYNMDLVYAAALLFGSEVLPHLIHALTGALTAALTFGVARRFLDWRVGLLAAVLLVYATRWGWANAYVDLGIMLFWSAAFAALALRHSLRDRRFSYLAAFFAGIAVGIKYQGLFYLPLFMVLALVVERRPAVVLRAVLIFAAMGGYWYLRNLIISGDPVHPIGGHLFGFWLWTPGDLAAQHDDLDRVRGWRDWLFLPALAAPLFWRGAHPFQRGLMLSAATALAIWYLVSGYWRYAVPIYPMLALLAAGVIVELWSRVARTATLRAALGAARDRLDPRLGWVLAAVLLLVVARTALRDTSRAWELVFPEGPERAAYLAQRFPGYALINSLGGAPVQTLYQLGFEGELYHLEGSVRGDWFGPGRYTDVLALAQDGAALARHLRGLGADGLLVNLAREPFSTQSWDPAMEAWLEPLGRSDRAALYRLRPAAEAGAEDPTPGQGGRSGPVNAQPGVTAP